MMDKVAIIYDFDKTLCTKDMQEYSLIPHLGYENPSIFWKEVSALSEKEKMDGISAYLFWLKVQSQKQGHPLRQGDFEQIGKDIELYNGVDSWFDRINAYGKQQNLDVEHYIISSGMEEIIRATSIAKNFKRIYACRYYYDEDGQAAWPAQIVNYTTKTQYIFRINKQVLDVNNDSDLNAYVKPEDRPIPFTRMIYIADGITDVPCMRLVKAYGGHSIAVYNPNSGKAALVANRLLEEGRANFLSEANYSEGSRLEEIVHAVLNRIHAEGDLEKLQA